MPGSRFLDLFAGSGIFSFEALSRGADTAVAVDISAKNIAAITKTAEMFGVNVETMVADIPFSRPRAESRELRAEFDLVYADPPYDFGRYDELLKMIDALPLAEGAIAALEHRRHTTPFTVEPRRLSFWRRAEYGEVWITFFTAPGMQLQGSEN